MISRTSVRVAIRFNSDLAILAVVGIAILGALGVEPSPGRYDSHRFEFRQRRRQYIPIEP